VVGAITRVEDFELMVWESGFRAQGQGLKIKGHRFRAQGQGLKIKGHRFRVRVKGFGI